MEGRGRRRLRVAAWLLMPFVVWAASFCGGWLGAVLGLSPLWLGIGGIVGGLVGLVAWLLVLRVLRQPTPSTATSK
jgi:hypothetical protein